jgi:hypothetical protein
MVWRGRVSVWNLQRYRGMRCWKVGKAWMGRKALACMQVWGM